MIQINSNEANPIQPGRYHLGWLALALFAMLSITFFPYLFGGKTFLPADMFDTMMAPFNAEYGPPQAQNHYPFDGIAQTYPYKVQTKEALEKGKLVYWNPHILGGYPEYAESMANNFDIFNVLLLWLGPVDVIHLETVIELFIAGLGMLLLLRFFGVSPVVNLIFASAYMLNSLFIASAMHRWLIASFCWIPFVIFMVLRYYYYHRKEDILFASVFLTLSFLGGNFQTSFFGAFVVATIILFYPSGVPVYTFLRRSVILIVLGLVAFALSAFMWLPTLELLFQTLFRGGSLNSSGVYAGYRFSERLLSLPLLANFFLPGLVGDPQIFSIKKFAGAEMMDFNGAISFLPALFGVWGCFSFRNNKNMRPFIALSVLSILLPIVTPLYSILYHRFFVVASFSLCVIGAVSFQAFIEDQSARNLFSGFFKWTKIIFGILVGMLLALSAYIALNYQSLLASFTSYVSPKIDTSTFGAGNRSWMLQRIEKTLHYYSFLSPALWLPIIGTVGILIALSFYSKGKVARRSVLQILLFATYLQLLLFARSWFPTVDLRQFPIFPQNPISTFLQQDSSGSRFIVWRDASKDPYILSRNSSNIYKTNDIHGYESMTNRSMIVFYLRHRGVDTLDLRLLGLANVKYIIAGKLELSSSNLRRLYSADSVTIYENLLCKPRAYFAYQSKSVESDSAAATELLRRDFDGSEALFFKEDAPPHLTGYSNGENTFYIDRSENEEVVISAQTDSKSIFILTDTYYPGWKCYVNAVETPIYRVNNCMRGIMLNGGTSKIVFRFEPDIFKAGASISAIAAFLSLAAIGFLKRKKTNRVKS